MRMKSLNPIACSLCAALFLVAAAEGATWYVPDDIATIQGAIDAAQNGDIVIVRSDAVHGGPYFENIDFKGKAITVTSEEGAKATTIDGSQFGSVVTFFEEVGLDSVIQGFTITNGSDSQGGGIYCYSYCSPTIIDNIITGNTAADGGGLNCGAFSSGLIARNRIHGNVSSYNGGGIACSGYCTPVIRDNTITENSANSGGAISVIYSDPIIENNIISGNSSTFRSGGISCDSAFVLIKGNIITNNVNLGDFGGGVYCTRSDATISENLIADNESNLKGGGIYCFSSHQIVTDNVIARNRALGPGGGINFNYPDDSVISNNMIVDNSADDGGGIHISGSSATLTSNTITGNRADENGGGLYLTFSSSLASNTILWDNQAKVGAEAMVTAQSTLDISYSDVKNGQSAFHVESDCTLLWGAGMFDADPLFFEADQGDLHLTSTSPCVNAGDNTAQGVPESDFEGDPRFADSSIDVGADEFHTHLYTMGGVAPGDAIDIRVVGVPFIYPVWLGVGPGIQDPPIPTIHGDLYLEMPLLEQHVIGYIGWNGILSVPATVPPGWNSGEEYAIQALVGPLGNAHTRLTNPTVLTVD